MTRLIDADALKAEWYRINDIDETDRGVRFVGYTEIARLIDNAPTVQASGDLISRESALAEFRDGRDVYDIMESIEGLPSAETSTASEKHQLSEETSTNTSTDLISRQDAIRKCCGEKCGCEREDCGYTECCSEVSRLERLPSASDSRQRGEWVIHDEVKNIYGGIYIECSECGTKFVTQTLEDERFCRNCGARMLGEDGEDE